MIKPSEAVVLAELRKTTLAYLSDSDFKEVEKAVERDGILSLQGSVGTIVKSAVKKHGSHNQSSHGRGGGKGGGGGSGSASSPKRQNPFTGEPTDDPRGVNPFTGQTFQQEVDAGINDTRDKGRDITNGLENNPQDDPIRDMARQKAFSMRESLDKASSAKTPEARKEALKTARSKIKPIVEMLEEQNYNSEAADLFNLSKDITSLISIISRGK